jgi:hypothetical protein
MCRKGAEMLGGKLPSLGVLPFFYSFDCDKLEHVENPELRRKN